MIRAYLYLFASGIIWLAEGFLFSRYLFLAPWQTGLLAVIYIALFAVAVNSLLRALRSHPPASPGVQQWRWLALAPVAVVIVGSFLSLPLILLVVALGKI